MQLFLFIYLFVVVERSMLRVYFSVLSTHGRVHLASFFFFFDDAMKMTMMIVPNLVAISSTVKRKIFKFLFF